MPVHVRSRTEYRVRQGPSPALAPVLRRPPPLCRAVTVRVASRRQRGNDHHGASKGERDMRKGTLSSSMLALATVLAVGACSGGGNRDSTAGVSGGDVGTSGAAGTGAAGTTGT